MLRAREKLRINHEKQKQKEIRLKVKTIRVLTLGGYPSGEKKSLVFPANNMRKAIQKYAAAVKDGSQSKQSTWLNKYKAAVKEFNRISKSKYF